MKQRTVVVYVLVGLMVLLAACGDPAVESKLGITSDADATVKAGDTVAVTFTLSRDNVSGEVTVEAKNLPQGINAEAVTTETTSATLMLVTTADLTPASYVIEIEARTASLSADDTTVNLTVSPADPLPADAPRVERIDFSTIPSVPEGLKISCQTSPDEFVSDGACPVILWNGFEYWPLDRTDNTGLALVAFAADGTVVKQWDSFLARYTWQITVDVASETVTIFGQGTGMVDFTWTELEITN